MGFLTGSVSRSGKPFGTPLLRNSIFLLLRTFVNHGMGFLFWLAVARLYLPADVGIAAVFLTTTLLLARAAALGLPLGILRFLPAHRDKVGLINAAFTVSSISSIALGVTFFAGLDVWAPALASVRRDPLLLTALFVSLVFFTLDGVLDNSFVAARRADYGLARTTIFYGLRLPLVFAFASLGVLGIALSWTTALVVSVLGTAPLLSRFFPGYRPAIAVRSLRGTGIFGFSLWSYGTGLVAGASDSLLPLLILQRLGADAGATIAAYYFAASALAGLLDAVPQSFSTSLLVEGSYLGTNFVAATRKTVRYSAPILALGIAGAILLGRPLLSLFGPSYAAESYGTLVALAFASPIMLAVGIVTASLRIAKRVRPIFAITSVSAGVTLTVAWLTIPLLGALGAASGAIAGQATSLTLRFFVVRRGVPGAAGAPASQPSAPDPPQGQMRNA